MIMLNERTRQLSRIKKSTTTELHSIMNRFFLRDNITRGKIKKKHNDEDTKAMYP